MIFTVKGISKRVIVVKAPISSIFDQAFFILNENCPHNPERDADELLREACMAADDYVRKNCSKRRRPALLFLFSIISFLTGIAGIVFFVIALAM